jgi:hypothetical protein
MSLIKDYLHTKMMDNLEMLTQREQLMEDIDCIVDDFFYEKYNGDIAERDELVALLCDTVCKNFPSN